jgi:hypothetical protein
MRKKVLITAAAASLALAGSAIADEKPIVTSIMKMGDAGMSCSALLGEAQAMETIMGGTPEGLDNEYLANVGTGLAQQAAIMGGAGRAAGAIGQVGGLLGKSSKKKKEQDVVQKALAEKRWLYIVGIYQGRACDAQGAANK